MESLSRTPILDFHSDTLQYIRKQYDLDHPDRMKEAIDIMEEWIKKQNHFEVKSFRRDYLERLIINNKGLLEKSKKKLDRLCTMRTLSPDYFKIFDLNQRDLDIVNFTILPKLTPNYYRAGIITVSGQHFSNKIIRNHFKHVIMVADYQQVYDYCDGLTYLFDFNNANMVDFVLNTNILDLRQFLEIILEGYSMKIKEMHLLTSSKSVEVIMTLFKQVFSDKLYKRVHIHKHIDSVYEYIPRDILPREYGGMGTPVKELRDNLLKELTSAEFMKHKKEMNKWRIDETHRRQDKFNDEYIGMSGTFRNLRVD